MGMNSKKFGGLEKSMLRIVRSMPQNQFYFVYNSFPESSEMVNAFKVSGAEFIVFPIGNWKKDILNIPKFVKLLKRIKPDIVHFHFTFAYFLYAPIARKLGAKRIYLTRHSCFTDGTTQITNKNQFSVKYNIISRYGKIYHTFDKIIMTSQYVYDQFEKIYGKSSKYQLIYFGVEQVKILPNDDKTNLRKELNIPDSAKVIVSVLFSSPIKGPDLIIKALPHIKYDNFVLVLVGLNVKLKYTDELHKLAESLGINDKIRWIGITDHVDDYLSIADIFCQPSRTEALSLAACEAKSAYLPVIGSRVGGLPEASDITFTNEDVIDLADKCTELLVNDELRLGLGESSYKVYQEKFNIEVGTKEYTKLYEN